MVEMGGATVCIIHSFPVAPGFNLEFMKVIVEGKRIKLLIVDTSGKERFREICTAYYRASKVNSPLLPQSTTVQLPPNQLLY